MEDLEPRFILLSGGLLIGLLYGALTRASGFCLRSALIELFQRKAGDQVLSWFVAILVAILGTQFLTVTGTIDLTNSIYLSDTLLWGGAIIGGTMFGFGMMLTRGCAARHIVLAMSGNLRSWLVLMVMGVMAYITLRGILGIPRQSLESITALDLDAYGFTGLNAIEMVAHDSALTVTRIIMVIAFVALSYFAVKQVKSNASVGHLIVGVIIGGLVPLGWYLTGVIGNDDFDPTPLVSLTFVMPVGNSIQYLMTYTGASSDFGVASVGGVLLGALLVTLVRRQWTLSGFDTPMLMVRYFVGASMMGIGGVMALGCSIGQGLTGLSTLSLGSFISIAGIVVGARVGFSYVRRERGYSPAPLPAE